MSTETLATKQDAIEMGLLTEEFDKICKVLNRIPNYTELSIFSVMY